MGYFDRVTVSLHILLTANQETEGSQDRTLKMGYFDRVTVLLHILLTANQETEGLQYLGRPSGDGLRAPFGRRSVLQRGYGLRLLIFKMANNKVDLDQIRGEEIVYSRFIKIPLG